MNFDKENEFEKDKKEEYVNDIQKDSSKIINLKENQNIINKNLSVNSLNKQTLPPGKLVYDNSVDDFDFDNHIDKSKSVTRIRRLDSMYDVKETIIER